MADKQTPVTDAEYPEQIYGPLMMQLSENTRRIDGLSRSLDKTKEDIGGLRTQIGEARGTALAADRGYHTLSERVANLTSSQERIEGKTNKHTDMLLQINKGVSRLDSVIMTGFKIAGLVIGALGLGIGIYKLITGG